MPGAIITGLQRHLSGGTRRLTPTAFRKTPQQGAATSILVATSPLLDGIGGRYFADCNESEPVSRRIGFDLVGVAPNALDPENADRLWEESLRAMPVAAA